MSDKGLTKVYIYEYVVFAHVDIYTSENDIICNTMIHRSSLLQTSHRIELYLNYEDIHPCSLGVLHKKIVQIKQLVVMEIGVV